MFVKRLFDQYSELYKKFIATAPNYDETYKWISLKQFQDNWDLEAVDFEKMYDNSFSNEISSNLWSSQFFFPKSVMLRFIKLDQERVRKMFRELFDEQFDNIEDRIEKFVFQCDILIDEIQKTDDNIKNHFHDGYRIISVYLSFMFPEKYCIYKFTEFKEFMTKVDASSIPGTSEIARFFKVMRTFYKILSADKELMKIHKGLIADKKFYQGDTLLLAQDFYWCCTREQYSIEKYS